MEVEMTTIGKVCTWVKGKKPSQLFDTVNENFIPYLSASYFRTNKPDYYANVNDKNCVPVINDDVVLIWDGSNAGDVFRGLTGALSSTMVKFNKSKECDNSFLFFLLKNNFKNLNRQTTGSTIPHVSGTVLKNIEILITNPEEQKSIAKVLSTIQEAIVEQEKLITGLKDLKQGLMQQLFTHGTKGEKTKMTEIGEIPESWWVVSLSEYLEKTKTSDPTKKPNEEFIYIDVSAVSKEFLKIVSHQKLFGRDAPSRARKHIQTGDIIFATVRPTLQRIAMVPDEYNNQGRAGLYNFRISHFRRIKIYENTFNWNRGNWSKRPGAILFV